MLSDATGWAGTITVVRRDLAGLVLDRVEFPNMITDAGLNLLRDVLSGAVADAEIKYVALGAGSTAAAPGDTALVDEQFRKAVTAQSAAGTGALDTTLYVAPAEATEFEIREIGWFAGPDATSEADSGVLVARVLYQRQKTNLESIQIDRRDTIGRA